MREEFPMSGQPRRNEDRFYRYPMHRVVAIMDDDSQVEAVLRELQRVGVEVSAVNVLSGPEGARLLDPSGIDHGLRGRLLRLGQQTTYEIDVLRTHERALQDGRHVIYVPVRDENRTQVIDILRAAGGRYLLYFGRWSVEDIPAQPSP